MLHFLRSWCGGGISVAANPPWVGPICVRDLQPGVPERPEPPNAPAAAQGTMEAAQKGDGRDLEKARVRVPWADMPTPWPMPCSRWLGWDQETLPEEAQRPPAVGLRQVLKGVCCSIRLQGASQDLWYQRPLLWLRPCFFKVRLYFIQFITWSFYWLIKHRLKGTLADCFFLFSSLWFSLFIFFLLSSPPFLWCEVLLWMSSDEGVSEWLGEWVGESVRLTAWIIILEEMSWVAQFPRLTAEFLAAFSFVSVLIWCSTWGANDPKVWNL